MVSTTLIVAAAAAFAACMENVNAHGYMYIPLAEFVDSTTSAWIVQIEPQWEGDWDDADGDDGMVELYQELKESNGYDDIRTLLDSNTTLYGADCGYTDPDADPKDPPTDGTATFSRGMVHAGPCEIWLDDTLVLTNDNCQDAYGDGTKAVKSVFEPMDYSSCSEDGCMLWFYWLAFQRVDSETVWQVYKDCVPLTGPASSDGSSTTTTSSDASSVASASASEATETEEDSDDNTSEEASSSASAGSEEITDTPESTTDSPTTDAPEATTETPSATTATPSSTEKCTARKRT